MAKYLIIFSLLLIFSNQSFAIPELIKPLTPNKYGELIKNKQTTTQNKNIVQGRIHSQMNSSTTELTIKLYDKKLNGEELLGTTHTDISGNYQISYSSAKSLMIRVYDNTNTLLTQSEVIYNPKKAEHLDLIIK